MNRKAIGRIAVLILFGIVLLLPKPTVVAGSSDGRESGRCIRGCLSARLSCWRECPRTCQKLFPKNLEDQLACTSACRTVCLATERVCIAVCNGEVPPPTKDKP